MGKPRYRIIIRERVGDQPTREFQYNRELFRPGSIDDEFIEAVRQQYDHHSYHGRLPYRGIAFRDADGNIQGVGMWYRNHRLIVKKVLVIV